MKYLYPNPCSAQGDLNPHNQHTSPENPLIPCRILCHQPGMRTAQGCCLPLPLGRLSWRLTASLSPCRDADLQAHSEPVEFIPLHIICCKSYGKRVGSKGYNTVTQSGGASPHHHTEFTPVNCITIHCTVHSNWPKTHQGIFERVNASLLCQLSCLAPVLLTALTIWVQLSSSTAVANCPSIIHSSSLTCNVIQVTAFTVFKPLTKLVRDTHTHCLDSPHLLNSAVSSKREITSTITNYSQLFFI